MILSDLESAEAMEDSLLVVAAYHHLDVQLAFVARLRYLSLAGRLSDKIGHLISLIDCEILTAVFRQFFIWGLDYLEELGGATKSMLF
jgi:hypothetical protein